MSADRKIIHIDCDSFYASVEELDNPRLRGRPLAVGGDPDRRGVIATCNYPARADGVHSAMPSARALQLCPELVILRPRFDRYRQISAQIREIMLRYTDQIEPLSLDEAFLDVSLCQQFDNRASRIAREIRRQVRQEIGITVSAGVAPNKFLAKIASDWRKPDGLFVITPDQVEDFIAALPVQKIFGVGRVTAERLQNMGVRHCADLQELSRLTLNQAFGSFGERLYGLCRGQDNRPVQSSRRRKSVSVEKTFDQDLATPEQWRLMLADLLARLRERLGRLDNSYSIAGLSAKVRYNDFMLSTGDSPAREISEENFMALLESLWERRQAPARLLGIGVRLRDMNAPEQPDLFPDERLAALASERSRQL